MWSVGVVAMGTEISTATAREKRQERGGSREGARERRRKRGEDVVEIEMEVVEVGVESSCSTTTHSESSSSSSSSSSDSSSSSTSTNTSSRRKRVCREDSIDLTSPIKAPLRRSPRNAGRPNSVASPPTSLNATLRWQGKSKGKAMRFEEAAIVIEDD
jgi:hypothetical protein